MNMIKLAQFRESSLRLTGSTVTEYGIPKPDWRSKNNNRPNNNNKNKITFGREKVIKYLDKDYVKLEAV